MAVSRDHFLDRKGVEDEKVEDEVRDSAKRYRLDDCQIRIIALMLHIYPQRVSKFRLLVKVKDDALDGGLADLMARKFIREGVLANGAESYELTPEFYVAYIKSRPFGMPLFEDCLEELKTSSYLSFWREDWMRVFYESCELPKNRRFKDAVDRLGVQEMDMDMQAACWSAVAFFIRNFTLPIAFSGDCCNCEAFSDVQVDLKRGLGRLVKDGLVMSLPVETQEETHETERYIISPRVVRAMFRGCDELARYDEMSKYTSVILAKDIAEKQLYFSEESQEEVDNLRKVLSEAGFRRAEDILERKKRNPAIQSLFWGPPGTGKTEVIKQIARETGRDIILFDAAKLTASAWGASEKNYRALFNGYNYLAAVCTRTPILVLNECDQFLAKRLGSIERAIDRSENTLSNILLQSFEDMSGILLATTNLATNLDEAFDRRFLFKTQLAKPDAKARQCIWKSLIPELSEEEAEQLADSFEMTGGQISNVVAKRDLAELYYEGDRGVEYISGLCHIELKEPTKAAPVRRVGF